MTPRRRRGSRGWGGGGKKGKSGEGTSLFSTLHLKPSYGLFYERYNELVISWGVRGHAPPENFEILGSQR